MNYRKKIKYNKQQLDIYCTEFPLPNKFMIRGTKDQSIDYENYNKYKDYIKKYLFASYKVYKYPDNHPINLKEFEMKNDILIEGKTMNKSRTIRKIEDKYPNDDIEIYKLIENMEIVPIKKENNSLPKEFYNPFKVNLLFEKVSKINLSDYNSIISFCDTYGLVGDKSLSKMPHTYIGSQNITKVPWQGVNLIYFMREVIKIRYYTQLWKDIKFKNPKLEERIIIDENNNISIDNTVITDYLPELKNQVQELSKTDFAKYKLLLGVNENLGGASPSLQLEDGELIPGYKAISLSNVIFAQLYDSITSNNEIRKCLYCGDLFIPEHGNSYFCPKEDGYERSPCENKYNQMKYQARKKIRSGKKTIEEFAHEKNRSIKEVMSWIDT